MLSPFRTGPPRLLQGHPVFTSRDIDDAREQVARLFCAHGLQQVAAAQALDCHMHRVPLGALSLNYLGYGADVEITPGCLGSFYLVQIPLAGQAEIRCGRQRAESDTRTAVVLSPDQPVAMRWHADCAQLMLHIPRALVEQRVSSAPDRPGARLDFALALPQSTGPAAGWCRMVLDLAHNIDAHGAAWLNHAAAVASLQDMLLAGLLSLQPHDQSAAAPPAAGGVPRLIDHRWQSSQSSEPEQIGTRPIDPGGPPLGPHQQSRTESRVQPEFDTGLDDAEAVRMRQSSVDVHVAGLHPELGPRPGAKARHHLLDPRGLVVLVVAQQFPGPDAVPLEEDGRPTGVFTEDEVGGAQLGEHANRDVLEVADRRRADGERHLPLSVERLERDQARADQAGLLAELGLDDAERLVRRLDRLSPRRGNRVGQFDVSGRY